MMIVGAFTLSRASYRQFANANALSSLTEKRVLPGRARCRIACPGKQERAMGEPILADYIVVGAGSAGCVLANRLSADSSNKILLLEAGGDDRPFHNLSQFWSNMLIHTPIGFGRTLNDPKVNWLYETEPDATSSGRPLKWPKGKVLGGSSSINGLLYIRGQCADYADRILGKPALAGMAD
jgi:hypothetical protein